MTEAILCLNMGSSSLKFAMYEIEELSLLQEGELECTGHFWIKDHNQQTIVDRRVDCKSPSEMGHHLFGVLKTSPLQFVATGHRVVHGGSVFTKPTLITAEVVAKLKQLSPLAPLHLPIEITMIEAGMAQMPHISHIACFDTAFFHQMDPKAKAFPIASKYKEVTRYGFHGLSYEYITQSQALLDSRVIIAHIGSGVSLAAIKDGKPIDTTMGFSPAGGVVMATRSGDLDPGVLIYLMRTYNLSVDQVESLVNRESGLLGLSTLSGDMQKLLQQEKNKKVEFALEIFCRSIAKIIGAFFVELGGLDHLIFTAGIGEHSPEIRRRVCSQLICLGATLNEEKNQANKGTISSQQSKCKISMIPTNENLMITKHTKKLLKKINLR